MSKRKFDHETTSFNKTNLAYLAHCSNIVYKPKKEIRKELKNLGFDTNGSNFFFNYSNLRKGLDTQCFVAGDNEKIIVSFRGSEANLADWITNKKFIKKTWNEKKKLG